MSARPSIVKETREARIATPARSSSNLPVEIGRRVLIDPAALALLSGDAREALLARGTPPDIVHALLAAVAAVARLPATRQAYRPNLGSSRLVARYVRAKHASKRYVAGSLFLDRRFDLLAEDGFDPAAEKTAEGNRLAGAARSFGAAGIIIFRYFRERKYLPFFQAADFTCHMREALARRADLRFLDYLLVTPDSLYSRCKLDSHARS